MSNGGILMVSITIRNLDDGVKKELRVRAAEQGTSMEEEARRILRSVVNRRRVDPATPTDPMEARLDELEKRGELIRSGVSPKVFPSGQHVPGALERFLIERHGE